MNVAYRTRETNAAMAETGLISISEIVGICSSLVPIVICLFTVPTVLERRLRG